MRRSHALLPTVLARTTLLRAPIVHRRAQSTYQPPTPPKPPSNAHRDFYKFYGYPIFKSMLIAIATYEVIYWGWLKLESLEVQADKEDEVKGLENEVKTLLKSKKADSG